MKIQPHLLQGPQGITKQNFLPSIMRHESIKDQSVKEPCQVIQEKECIAGNYVVAKVLGELKDQTDESGATQRFTAAGSPHYTHR